MTDLLRVLHQDISERVRDIEKDGWPCRKGCDSCCRSLHSQPVLTEVEWRLLQPSLTAALLERAMSAADRVCPLLDADSGSCTLYEVRPIACRTYGFYADREGGLYCSQIENLPGLENVVWGNAEAVERRLDSFGPRRRLSEWIALGDAITF